MVARLGAQIELPQEFRRKIAPRSAMRSIFGVLFINEPYALMACWAWSSLKMKTILGLPVLLASAERSAGSVKPSPILPRKERRDNMATFESSNHLRRGGVSCNRSGRQHKPVRGETSNATINCQTNLDTLRFNDKSRCRATAALIRVTWSPWVIPGRSWSGCLRNGSTILLPLTHLPASDRRSDELLQSKDDPCPSAEVLDCQTAII